MTTDRDFERTALAWLADGPEELSDRVLDAVAAEVHLTRQRHPRVPWRYQHMSNPVRAATAAVIGVLLIGGVVFLARPGQSGVGGPGPTPTPRPTATATTTPSVSPPPAASSSAGAAVSPPPVSVPALTQTFTSSRHGYSIRLPADWTAIDATSPWTTGIDTLYDDPALDKLGKASEARLAVASTPLLPGQTPERWLAPFCRSGSTKTECGREVSIGGQTGHMDEDGVSASGGTVETDGFMYDAVVVVGGRGYIFILDGHVDQAYFDALMASVTFDPEAAIDKPAESPSPS